MPQVQMFDLSPTPSRASMLGERLGQALSRNLPSPEQLVQEKRLTNAFQKLSQNPNASYEKKLASILPTLASTPGGSEIAANLLPLIKGQSIKKYNQPGNKPKEIGGQPTHEMQPNVSPEQRYRNPEISVASNESFYPETQIEAPPKIRTGEEIFNDARNMSEEVGIPIAEALQFQKDLNNQAIQQHNLQEQQRQVKKTETRDIESALLKQAKDSNLLADETTNSNQYAADKEVLNTLAQKYKKLGSDVEMWKAMEPEYKNYQSAIKKLENSADIPNIFNSITRKLNGTYKDFEQISDELQPSIEELKKYNQYDRARSLLEQLGMGPEQIETTLFPLSKAEKKTMESFGTNPMLGKDLGKQFKELKESERRSLKHPFRLVNPEVIMNPKLDDKKFEEFKYNVLNYLNQNKGANLIALRGYLNRKMSYNYQDISRAIKELQKENLFKPDTIQTQQLPVIEEAPLPGLGEQFKYFFKGSI